MSLISQLFAPVVASTRVDRSSRQTRLSRLVVGPNQFRYAMPMSRNYDDLHCDVPVTSLDEAHARFPSFAIPSFMARPLSLLLVPPFRFFNCPSGFTHSGFVLTYDGCIITFSKQRARIPEPVASCAILFIIRVARHVSVTEFPSCWTRIRGSRACFDFARAVWPPIWRTCSRKLLCTCTGAGGVTPPVTGAPREEFSFRNYRKQRNKQTNTEVSPFSSIAIISPISPS